MSTSKRWVQNVGAGIVAACLITLSGYAQSTNDAPKLGVPLSEVEIAQINFTVLPNGEGLPVGEGNAQAGAALFLSHCQACHGTISDKGINDQLSGGHGSLQSQQPVKTVGSYWPYATTIFSYIRRAMPYTEPGRFSADEVYALTAYLLFINGVVNETDVMNARTLPSVSMPNAEGFEWSSDLKLETK